MILSLAREVNIKHLAYLLLAGLIPLLIACSTEKIYKDAEAVIEALDKHVITDCHEVDYELIGANSGLMCKVTSSDEGTSITFVEIYTWEEHEAIMACQQPQALRDICSEGPREEDESSFDDISVRYYRNVQIVVRKIERIPDADKGTTTDALISDLKD